MKLHFEETDLTERQECSALTSNLEGTGLNCVTAKNQNQRDTCGWSYTGGWSFVVLLIVLITPNRSIQPVSASVYASFS